MIEKNAEKSRGCTVQPGLAVTSIKRAPPLSGQF